MAIIHCLGVGLVGSYVAKKLSANGHQVHAHDLYPGVIFSDYPRIIIHEGDVLETSKDKNNYYQNLLIYLTALEIRVVVGHL